MLDDILRDVDINHDKEPLMSTHYAYWISTTLLTLLYLASAMLYVVKKDWVRQTLAGLNYPAPYLLPFMVVVKVLGPLAIVSRLSVPLSDLAYAGIFFHLLLSASAHLGVRKPKGALPAFIGLVLLAVSFTTQNAARDTPSPYGAGNAVQQTTPWTALAYLQSTEGNKHENSRHHY